MDFDFGVPSRAHEIFQRLENQGADFLQTLVAAQKSEELFLDYKQITTSPEERTLGNTDRKNLRKALSGFANSEGGVILWGCKTKKIDGVEVLEMPDGYPDVARFVSLLEDAVSGCTVPPVPGVRSISFSLSADGTKGIAATLVPASLIAPHQTTDDSRAYHMRAGSSFPHVPHGVLAGMFGRRPSPKIALNFRAVSCWMNRSDPNDRLSLTFELELANISGVTARNAYISWHAKELYSITSSVIPRLAVPSSSWHVEKADARNGSVISEEVKRLAPYSRSRVVKLELDLQVEPTEGLEITLYFGCEGSPPGVHQILVSKEKVISQLEKMKNRRGRQYEDSLSNMIIAEHLLNIAV